MKLYVQRVFIMDRAEEFLPLYLRFIRGVVDSSDLSLNVSREILQKDARVEAMKSAVTRRALDMLAKLAKDDSEVPKFWDTLRGVPQRGSGRGLTKQRADHQVIAIRVYKRAQPHRRLGLRVTLPEWLTDRQISFIGV